MRLKISAGVSDRTVRDSVSHVEAVFSCVHNHVKDFISSLFIALFSLSLFDKLRAEFLKFFHFLFLCILHHGVSCRQIKAECYDELDNLLLEYHNPVSGFHNFIVNRMHLTDLFLTFDNLHVEFVRLIGNTRAAD